MQGPGLKVLTAAAVLGLSPLLLSAQSQSGEARVQPEGGAVAADKPATGAGQPAKAEADTNADGSVAARKPAQETTATPPGGNRKTDSRQDASGKMQVPPKIKIDPIVREGTAHLDIDETTRSRYTYFHGHWWFYMGNGEWMISKNGKWEPVDTSKYHKSRQRMTQPRGSQAGGNAYGNGRPNAGSGRYYDNSPAYGNYYGNGTYYDGSYTRPFYNNYGRGDYGRGYYGNGFYGRGYYGRGYYGNGYYGRGLNNGSSNGRFGTGGYGGYSGGLGGGSSGGAAIGLGP